MNRQTNISKITAFYFSLSCDVLH